MDGLGRFRAKGQPLGVSDNGFPGGPTGDVNLIEGPALWLRVMPQFDLGKRWTLRELKKAATSPRIHFMPINDGPGSYGYIRAEDGFGMRVMLANRQYETFWVAFAFDTGEIWTIDSYLLTATREQNIISLDENSFVKPLHEYVGFLTHLGANAPYRWIAGIEDVKGRGIIVPPRPGQMRFHTPRGSCISESIVVEGQHSPGESARRSLRPFFETIYDKCGIERPAYLDD